MNKKALLNKIYKTLEDHYGDLGWWPAETPFEMAIGAILTQNTAWRNVETAISGLKEHALIDVHRICKVRSEKLSRVIRSSGYHRVKADRLKALAEYLMDGYDGNFDRMKKRSMGTLRRELLGVRGVGPETADSILLYALDKPLFVVDAYARRVFERHGLIQGEESYDHIQELVHDNFRGTVKQFNRFHAYLVETGKRFCKKNKALCRKCPLSCFTKKTKKGDVSGSVQNKRSRG